MSAFRRAFSAVVAVTLVGQLCAVIYEVVVAGRFGTRLEGDALALALTLALGVANEVVTWVSTLFIPHYVEARSKGPAGAARFFRATAALLAAGSGALAALLVVGAPGLVTLLAPGAARELGTELVRFFAPLLVLLPLSTLLAGTLQAHGRFVVAALRHLCWYGVALLSVVTLGRRMGPSAVAIGMVGGLLLFCSILALAIAARGGAPSGGEAAALRLRRAAWSLLPLVLASVSNYVNIAVERGIAARLPEGSLAALTYAFRLLNFPVNLLLLNATTMLFPSLAVHAASGDIRELEALVRRALRLSIVFTVPLAALAIALAEPGIRLLLQRGAFTADSTQLTASALIYYAPAVVGMAGVQVLSRAYQALHEVRRLVWTGISVIGLNVALMLGLTAVFGFRGLPVATSINWTVLLAVMLVAIRKRLPGLRPLAIAESAGRAAVAGGVGVGAAWLALAAIDGGPLPGLLAGGLMGIGAYAVVLFWLAREDAKLAAEFVTPRRFLHTRAGSPT